MIRPMDGLVLTLAAGGGSGIAAALGLVVLLGVGAQWLAWRLRIPSILLLLLFGILAGPVAREFLEPGHILWLDPDRMFGPDLLLSLVGVSVGLILYEGGLTLNFRELRRSWRSVAFLVTTGALVTWIVAGLAAKWVVGLPTPIAVQLGAVLIVTGPTVIGPLLNHIRPAGSTGLILKWEGIVIDPIGVGVAVLVFEAIALGPVMRTPGAVFETIAVTVLVGGSLGVISAFVLREVMRRYWVPDTLQKPRLADACRRNLYRLQPDPGRIRFARDDRDGHRAGQPTPRRCTPHPRVQGEPQGAPDRDPLHCACGPVATG
jgi:NhaP-type Na+/H+ or K+/H+ antiporter